MRISICVLVFVFLAACGGGVGEPVATAPNAAVELGLRQLRNDYHEACTTGDATLLRSRWADDAVLTTEQGTTLVGGDEITQFIADAPTFGTLLALTPEGLWWVVVRGQTADFGFETVFIDVGGNDPMTTLLASQGSQNPDVEIVEHTYSTGRAVRGPDGRWVFEEFTGGTGPLPPNPEQDLGEPSSWTAPRLGFELGDDLGFRRMRQDFHLANTTADPELLRTVWADDAVFRGGGNEVVGRDAIVDFFANGPFFGKLLNLTPEFTSMLGFDGGAATYAFECIGLDLGGASPRDTVLASQGSQNPAVEIVWHSNTMGRAIRAGNGRWEFLEFNGGPGPLPSGP